MFLKNAVAWRVSCSIEFRVERGEASFRCSRGRRVCKWRAGRWSSRRKSTSEKRAEDSMEPSWFPGGSLDREQKQYCRFVGECWQKGWLAAAVLGREGREERGGGRWWLAREAWPRGMKRNEMKRGGARRRSGEGPKPGESRKRGKEMK